MSEVDHGLSDVECWTLNERYLLHKKFLQQAKSQNSGSDRLKLKKLADQHSPQALMTEYNLSKEQMLQIIKTQNQ